MRRVFACGVLAVFLHIASLSAQQAPGWGDELPPAPELPESLLAIPRVELPIIQPAPPLTRPPSPVHAIYVNAWAFGGRRFYDLVRLADRTEINAFVVDVKDDTGYLTYRSEVPTAVGIGANGQLRARDVRERLRVMREHGIHPIARIVVAKDPLLAARKPAWSVRHVDGGLWHDRLDFAWVDAFNDSVWVYAAQLAAEAVRAGFAEVQYDYVRFPDEPESRLASAVFAGRRPGETKRQGVSRNLRLLGERTRPLGVPFTIDVFGLTTSAPTDMGIGQMWEDLVTTADVVLPMVYPSHYFRGYYSLKHPNSEPYKVIRRAMQDALRRSQPLGKTAEIRPYLQAFTLGPPRYTPALVREQIRAAEELGITSWVLWNPRSAYDAGIFRPRAVVTSAARPSAPRPADGTN
ncbi:MAG TPA: putative glycoside hydrolase [Gemmatimonadales bacterium]|nr:putative glycoside hydrolase [Gemmatimonadales bacterium]